MRRRRTRWRSCSRTPSLSEEWSGEFTSRPVGRLVMMIEVMMYRERVCVCVNDDDDDDDDDVMRDDDVVSDEIESDVVMMNEVEGGSGIHNDGGQRMRRRMLQKLRTYIPQSCVRFNAVEEEENDDSCLWRG